ncbi:MAG: bifunctional UDP-N-acetylglucosamine diphosphorylase/glucosamine-1-phosphate N-acetyltransferase GlmU [Rickettsiales bacterium]|nr:bifunctional UDP-N-acetylglucosamine diphosphorylase/glucosamine-1-phosphate N-acetyltransferase GlmU [Rickettsiales bacterium]
MSISIIILAAGKGTRMKSDLPKVMHKIAGREMVNLVIDEVKQLDIKNITVVVSDEMELFQKQINNSHKNLDINFAIQAQRNGTGHAVMVGVDNISSLGEKVIVLYGDTPITAKNTITSMLNSLDSYDLCVLGFEEKQENKYGRLVVDENKNLKKIVEFKDANEDEKKITLCNSGVMAINGQKIKELLSSIDNNNATGEYYLTDIVEICDNKHYKKTYFTTSKEEVLGVNSKIELANLENIMQDRLRKQHMENGVTLIDPNTVYFCADTKIGKNCIIYPNVFFGANVEIGDNVEIKSFSHLEEAKISKGCVIGPFARIRPGANLGEDVKIGNFVEIKKSNLAKGAKVNHLSYIGDSDIGENSNIGAGTITCNYDGYKKHKTIIGDNCFVGSNSAFIAPVKIADGAVIGAGSIITKEVKENELAVSRPKQINIENGGTNFHKDKSN